MSKILRDSGFTGSPAASTTTMAYRAPDGGATVIAVWISNTNSSSVTATVWHAQTQDSFAPTDASKLVPGVTVNANDFSLIASAVPVVHLGQNEAIYVSASSTGVNFLIYGDEL